MEAGIVILQTHLTTYECGGWINAVEYLPWRSVGTMYQYQAITLFIRAERGIISNQML